MLYTSYFAAISKLPENYIPVAICGKSPETYKGVEYKKLAPKKDFFMQWKENHDNDFYCKNYKELVTDKLDANAVIEEMINFLPYDMQMKIRSSNVPIWRNPDYHIVMICYEKPEDFCHRHLVADWLMENGIVCRELILS